MTRVCAVAVLVALVVGGPVSAQQQKPVPQDRSSPSLYWGGIATAAVGGFMVGWGLGGEEHRTTCAAIFLVAACVETGINKVAWIGTGAGIMAGGLAMSAIGGRKVARAVAAAPELQLARSHGRLQVRVAKTIQW